MAKRSPRLASIIFLICIGLTPALGKPSPAASPVAKPVSNPISNPISNPASAPSVNPAGSTILPRRTLKVSVMDGPPWCMRDEDGHWTGMTIDLLRDLAEELHFDYEFKESNLSGVQDLVQNNQVDLCGAGLAITAEREARFDFSDPYCVFDQTVAVNADQQPSLFDGLRATFLGWGFLAIVLALIAITVLGAAIFWLLEQRGDSEYYAPKDKRAFARSLLWSVMVLAGRDIPKSIGWDAQPLPELPPSRTRRLAFRPAPRFHCPGAATRKPAAQANQRSDSAYAGKQALARHRLEICDRELTYKY